MESHQDGSGLEHLLCEEQLRDLGFLNLEKRQFQEDLLASFQCLGGGHQEDRARFFTMGGQETMDIYSNKELSDGI